MTKGKRGLGLWDRRNDQDLCWLGREGRCNRGGEEFGIEGMGRAHGGWGGKKDVTEGKKSLGQKEWSGLMLVGEGRKM